MIVVDRRLAIIPGPGGDLSVAIAVREPALVAYLVDVFERAWERARPFTNTERTMMNDIAREQRAMTIRMLIEGHSDPVSAKRLGVSARTFAGYVADLKEEYDAETALPARLHDGPGGRLGSRGRVTTHGRRTWHGPRAACSRAVVGTAAAVRGDHVEGRGRLAQSLAGPVGVGVSRSRDAERADAQRGCSERQGRLPHHVHELHILPVGETCWSPCYPFSGRPETAGHVGDGSFRCNAHFCNRRAPDAAQARRQAPSPERRGL